MKHVVPVRRALKVRTVFNILGPLLNPATAQRLMLGVYSPSLLPVYGQVLYALKVEHALVVHCCGLDELAPLGTAEAVEVTREGVKKLTIDVLAYDGVEKCTIADLKGGDCQENAKTLVELFSGGEKSKGPVGDTVALNAGAGLYVYGLVSPYSCARADVECPGDEMRCGAIRKKETKKKNKKTNRRSTQATTTHPRSHTPTRQAPSVEEGFKIARAALTEGKALHKLEEWVTMTHRQSEKEKAAEAAPEEYTQDKMDAASSPATWKEKTMRDLVEEYRAKGDAWEGASAGVFRYQ